MSAEMRAELTELGILSYKVSDRYHTGIPDIYIPSGIWIETKVIPRMPTQATPPIRYFPGPQRKEIRKLMEAGDEVLAAVLFCFDMSTRGFVLAPWWEFERIAVWNYETIISLGRIFPAGEKRHFSMASFFSMHSPGKLDLDIWWNDAFSSWLKRYPEQFDHKKRVGKWARVRWEDGEAEGGEPSGLPEADEEAGAD